MSVSIFKPPPSDPPKLWEIVLRGHFEDVEEVAKVIRDNQREVQISTNITMEDDDQACATILLHLKEPTMIFLVQSIIDGDFPNVEVEKNGEKNAEGQQSN